MLNHKDREEVQSALTDGVGLAERMSDTLSEKLFIMRCDWKTVMCCVLPELLILFLRQWQAVFLI